jgi:hypothetical protein
MTFRVWGAEWRGIHNQSRDAVFEFNDRSWTADQFTDSGLM